MADREAVIVNGARPAMIKIDTGATAVQGALERPGVKLEDIHEVIIGHARHWAM